MFTTLGLGSATAIVSTVVTVFADRFPRKHYKMITKAVCVSMFLIGLFYLTPGGTLILDLADTYVNLLFVIIISLEVIAITWVYGTNQILQDLGFMIKMELGIYWKICLAFISVFLPGLFLSELFTWEMMAKVSTFANAAGMAIPAVGLGVILFKMIHSIVQSEEDHIWKKIK